MPPLSLAAIILACCSPNHKSPALLSSIQHVLCFRYNHSSEDAEIYREFLDVATRIMPDIFKSVAMENRSCCEGPIVNDPVDGAYQPDNLLGTRLPLPASTFMSILIQDYSPKACSR
ncbi:unnamed protein product [Dibothriocephalus latus]|uniref:Uncharacterized protein n=1 Tax=Dibothriocephalus latus TaxID=60516 RepID=A0A3P7N100_DIBLA|nr:unnamed protein product [Dibothriocephalus latus]